jgi:hypothetical protein
VGWPGATAGGTPFGDPSERIWPHVNGDHVNGNHVNGHHVNGHHVNGHQVNGHQVNGKGGGDS